MSDNYVYKLQPKGPDAFPSGTYENEQALIDALRQYNQRHALPRGAFVHVYETDATPLGIGRKYVGCINAGSVLMAGEVPMDRVKS